MNPTSSVTPSLQRTSARVLKCLPKASREGAARKLASILDVLVNKNDYTSWVRLLRFAARCLRYPGRGGRGSSLATAVNRQVREETDPQACNKPIVRRDPSPLSDPARFLAIRVSTKLEEGDFNGAVRLASSEDTQPPSNLTQFWPFLLTKLQTHIIIYLWYVNFYYALCTV